MRPPGGTAQEPKRLLEPEAEQLQVRMRMLSQETEKMLSASRCARRRCARGSRRRETARYEMRARALSASAAAASAVPCVVHGELEELYYRSARTVAKQSSRCSRSPELTNCKVSRSSGRGWVSCCRTQRLRDASLVAVAPRLHQATEHRQSTTHAVRDKQRAAVLISHKHWRARTHRSRAPSSAAPL
jgi:hypothetical protein